MVRSAEGFARALDGHLGRIAAATRAADVQVVVHNFAALPEQTPDIERLATRYGFTFVDVMGALAAADGPDRFFHPTNHLRMSPEGNAWLAAQLEAAVLGERAPVEP